MKNLAVFLFALFALFALFVGCVIAFGPPSLVFWLLWPESFWQRLFACVVASPVACLSGWVGLAAFVGICDEGMK